MNIIVLHGEDSAKSYLRLVKFIDTAKKRSWEVIYTDQTGMLLEETLSASSLFQKERFFIHRDVKKLGKKELAWLNKNADSVSGTLIIYHGDLLSATLLKSMPKNIKIEEFKLAKIIWNFLDNIYPGNSESVLKTFHKILETDPPELVFSLIAKQLRDLYWVKVSPNTTAIPPWKTSKLNRQASRYSIENLKHFINSLTEIDVSVKTGKNDLVSSLDLLLVKQLQ